MEFGLHYLEIKKIQQLIYTGFLFFKVGPKYCFLHKFTFLNLTSTLVPKVPIKKYLLNKSRKKKKVVHNMAQCKSCAPFCLFWQ